jgi:ferritin
MISKTMGDALNEQVKWELYSAYLYLSMAAYFESVHLQGFAHWMKKQAQEETTHAMKLFDYLASRDYRIRLLPIDAPPSDWRSAEEVFDETYKHEQRVTGLINGLVRLSEEENDRDTREMLRWFEKEQEEEEENAEAVLKKTRAAGDNLRQLDQELGTR